MKPWQAILISFIGSFLLVVASFSGLWSILQFSMKIDPFTAQEYYNEASFYTALIVFIFSVSTGLGLFLWGLSTIKKLNTPNAVIWIVFLIFLTLYCSAFSAVQFIFYI